MKNKLLFALLICLSCHRQALAQLTLGTDTPSCANTSTIQLNAAYTGYIPTATGLDVDDGYSCTVCPLGFSFSFYGTSYTSCVVGGNGTICFDTTQACGYEAWDIVGASPMTIPGNPNCNAQVLGCYSDIYSPGGGTISYATVGDAPNRKFVVTFCSVPMYGAEIGDCPGDKITFQMILYETSNNIEVHITTKNTCTAWNGGLAIQGLQDPTGTVAIATPGRNATVWTAYNDAVRFTPTSPTVTTGYTESAITYAPLSYAYSTIYWYVGSTLIGTGSPLSVSPDTTTTYRAMSFGCNDTTIAYITVPGVATYDSILGIFPPHITSATATNPVICGIYNTDSINLYGIAQHYLDTFFYSIDGVPQPPVVDSSRADSSVNFTNLVPGTYTFYYATPGGCLSNTVTATITNPPVTASFTDAIHLGCNGDSVFITNASNPSGYYSYWNFGDGSAVDSTDTNPVHIYADAATGMGTYTISLTYRTAPIAACTASDSTVVNFNHPLVASFSADQSSVCLGVPITFTNTSIGNGATYLWNFGDGSTDISTNPVHTFGAGGLYNVTLTVTDTIPCTQTAVESIDVIAIDVHTSVHDTSVCLLDSMYLHAYTTVTGVVSGINYSWTPTNNIGEPNDSVTTFMGIGGYTYSVTATTVPLGCFASDTEAIHSFAPVTFTGVTASQTIAYGSSVQLNADGATLYTWTPDNGTLSNPNISNPVATPVDSVTTYTVYGMNPYGCLDSASLTITLTYSTPEFVPSAFTPNHDGLNDLLKVGNLKLSKLVDFRVFNRWGQQIFQTSNPEVGWDGTFNGTPQDIGTYSYMVIISHADGQQQTITGNVALIR
jgi:gliding motility-associated-like protein